MEARDRSLDLASGDGSAKGGAWAVVGDVALSLVLVLVLFVLAQFLHYDKVFVLEEIDRRRDSVERLVMSAAAEVLDAGALVSLEIESVGFSAQRIRFPEAMLFGSCDVEPRPEGVHLIESVARAVGGHVHYFEAIQIEGHADPRPPTGDCQRRVGDNWGLSSARATGFVRVFIDPAVFPVDGLVSAVGRGDTQLLTDRFAPDSELGRNRRIELILMYSEANARDALESGRSSDYASRN